MPFMEISKPVNAPYIKVARPVKPPRAGGVPASSGPAKRVVAYVP